jgi:hypothetical protein
LAGARHVQTFVGAASFGSNRFKTDALKKEIR